MRMGTPTRIGAVSRSHVRRSAGWNPEITSATTRRARRTNGSLRFEAAQAPPLQFPAARSPATVAIRPLKLHIRGQRPGHLIFQAEPRNLAVVHPGQQQLGGNGSYECPEHVPLGVPGVALGSK